MTSGSDRSAAAIRVGQLAREHRFEAAGDRLDRRERVVDLVADDADQPLPRLTLLVAQRPADVGEHQQLVRTAFLTERRAPHFPAARCRRGTRRPRCAATCPSRQVRRPSSSAVRPSSCSAGLRQQPLAGAVDEPQRLRAVEGEDGDVDLHHHRAQQRAGLERAEALIVQRRGEDVDFEHHRAERIVAARAARADREVALAQRRQQVRQRLQRQHDAMADAERAAGPDADDEHRQRPLHFGGVVAGPEQDERDERRREAGREREQQDALVEAQTRVGPARRSGSSAESGVVSDLAIRNSELGMVRNSCTQFLSS